MHGATHLILSWGVAEGAGLDALRERRIVTLAGIAPDADVIVYLAGMVWFGGDVRRAFEWHAYAHHRFTHGIGFVLLTGAVAYLLSLGPRVAWRRLGVALLAMLTSALHTACDLIGSGPRWPIYPWWPFSSEKWGLRWSWTLADWPNLLIVAACLAGAYRYALWKGRSPLETFHAGLDRHFVSILRRQR